MVPVRRAYLLKSPKESSQVLKMAPGTSVVRVPGLAYFQELLLQLADEREESQAVGCHGERITLRHPILAEDEARPC
jgi:hypothetical protein